MKKSIFLIFILSVLSFLSGFSQYKYKITKCNSHLLFGKEWFLFQENYPKKMFVSIDSAVFRIDNKDQSEYRLYGDSTTQHYPEFTTYTWDAYDKDRVDCKAVITELLNDDCTFYFSVFYPQKCYNYMLTEID